MFCFDVNVHSSWVFLISAAYITFLYQVFPFVAKLMCA